MVDFPGRSQTAPDYWDTQLKAYIDASADGDQNAEAIKKARALRAWYVAQGTADATAVDILFTTGDSITEGAYATGTGAWEKRYVGVFNDMIRRALQPVGVPGGSSYYGFGSNLILSGAGFIGGTGTLTQDFTRGLGLKSWTLANAAVFSFYFIGDAADLLYSTDPSYGSIAITVDGVSAGSVNQAVAASGGNKKRLTGVGSGVHTVVVTSTGTTNLEGVKPYNGDTAVGYRVWEAGHSGYGAHEFQTQTKWADSVPAIPNPRLVIMSGSSNDYYSGRTKAQSKADTLANIALLRTKISGEFSIVLLSYYDRPVPGTVTTQWQDFVDMYEEIAAADPLVWHLDLDTVFGHKTSDTDDRGGLVNNTDYVHPTNAGHKIIGKFVADGVIPEGQAGGGPFNNTLDAAKPVSAAQALADTAAAAGLPWFAASSAGALNFAALPIQNYQLTLNGTPSTLSPSGMPPVSAGRTATVFIRYIQDATGSRTLTHSASFRKGGAAYPVLSTTAAASNLLRYFWDGAEWWVEDVSNPTISTVQQTAITAASGDATVAQTSAGISGALNFGAFQMNLTSFRLTLNGNATLSAAAMPANGGKSGTYRVRFTQDATGGRTLTLSGFLIDGGIAPILSTTAGASDLFEFYYDGANWWVKVMARGDGTPSAVVKTYLTNATWAPSFPGLKTIDVTCIGAGGAGGSGRQGATLSARWGGGGGSGGTMVQATVNAALLAATENVLVGVGPAGGAAIATPDTNGADGSAGPASNFGSSARGGVFARGGTQGNGGTAVAGSGGGTAGGGAGGASSITTGAGGGGNVFANTGGAGGGGGGGIDATNGAHTGGNGGFHNGGNGSTTAVVPGGTPFSAPAGSPVCGQGGPGGGSNATGPATDGTDGGNYGAGGGGGSASLNGNNSGKGGKGGAGIVQVIEYY